MEVLHFAQNCVQKLRLKTVQDADKNIECIEAIRGHFTSRHRESLEFFNAFLRIFLLWSPICFELSNRRAAATRYVASVCGQA